MYFNNQQFNILTVDDDFAMLRRTNDVGDLEFRFTYSVSQHAAIEKNALTVKVSVFTKHVTAPSTLASSQLGLVDSMKLICNILMQVPRAKNAAKQQQDTVVATTLSDISAKINNEIIAQLLAKVGSNDIAQLIRPGLSLVSVDDIKRDNDSKPVLGLMSTTQDDALKVDEPRTLMFDMLVRQGIDPSDVLKLTSRNIAAVDSVAGTLTANTMTEFSEQTSLSRLLNYYVFNQTSQLPTSSDQIVDGQLMHVLSNIVSDELTFDVDMTVPKFDLDGQLLTNFFVKFELIDHDTNLAVDSITKSVNIPRFIQLLRTPRKPPTLKASKSEVSTRVNLEIKQIDPNATMVMLYKKSLSRASIKTSEYMFLGTYPLTANQQSLLIQADMPKESTVIYRVIAAGQNTVVGSDYSNVVVTPPRFVPVKSIALNGESTDVGVRLEVHNLPKAAVAVEFLVRNLTIFEREFRSIDNDVVMINDVLRSSDFMSTTDRNVFPGNTYEYVTRLLYKSGVSELAGNAIIEVIQPAPGQVDTRVTNVVVSSNTSDVDVTFDVSTTIIDSDSTVVRNLLKNQGILDSFQNNVDAEREFLNSLIAHNVQRVDITSGERVDFGTLTTGSFSDSVLRKNQSIDSPLLGHKYRYEVTALLRAPETLFNTFQKTVVDPTTKKSYVFNPAKFFHPVTLNQGTVVTPTGAKVLFSKDPMSHGAIGSTQSIDVSLDAPTATIIDASVSQFNKKLNIVSWKVQGTMGLIDHFVIMKEINGARSLVGKAHSKFQNGNCQYLHELTHRDSGSITYILVPIYNDYHVGDFFRTNSVTIHDGELI